MPRTQIEHVKGRRKMCDKQKLVTEARYDIRVYANYTDTKLLDGSDRSSETAVGSIEVNIDQVKAAASLTLGQRLTLHLEDGRRLDIFVAGSRGQLTATGPIYSV
jgi:hypothetical protein